MAAAVSTTRWRDKPIVLEDYDLAVLVPLARRTRGRLVDFDWAFSPGDLRCLRRAVYEWGSATSGRYRCFDARVLAAINTAIGETNSVFALKEPTRDQGIACEASCVAEDDVFRLRGHAPFDIIFGYGLAGAGQNSWSSHLGPTVQETLANAVGMLDWDLRRLREARFQPVRNVLYGLPVGYGLKEAAPPPGPVVDVSVDFHGPFSALGEDGCRCLFTHEIASRSGVYLWTINVNGREQPWYVGQTRRGFGQRMGEHLAAYLSGQYQAYDAVELSKGLYQRAAGAVDEGLWPQTLPSFLRNSEVLIPNITKLIRLFRFHVAPLEGDAHLHNRVEGLIGRHFKAHADRELRDFFVPGIKLPAAIPYDSAIRLVLSSEAPIAGFPPELS